MAKQGSYGLKEVADVKFYPVSSSNYPTGITTDGVISWSGTAPTATYTFDSLKVSTLEMSAQEASAKGGKGNPELIIWQYGKELKLTCEDALLNMDTLKLMFGGTADANGKTLVIDSNTFNGNYAITGQTVMRSYATGQDEAFLFFIPKANVKVGGTLTMQADGDPSTFSMEIKALSSEVGSQSDILIEFIKASSALTINGTETIKIQWPGAVTATSSAAAKATVVSPVVGGIVNITGVAAGDAVITVSDSNSAVLGTISVTVVAG